VREYLEVISSVSVEKPYTGMDQAIFIEYPCGERKDVMALFIVANPTEGC